MYQKTLIILDWIVIFCVYFLVILSTSLSGQIFPQLNKNTVDALLNLVINIAIGLVFIGFLVYLIKRTRNTPLSSYIWLLVFFIITVFFLFRVETTRERLHFLGYGIMSLVLYRALRHRIGTKILYLWSCLIIIIFAILDERLQSFIARGSSFEFRDIVIDWLSALLAQFLILLVARPKLENVDIKIRKDMDKLKRIRIFNSERKG